MIGWESVEIIQSSEREDIGTEILVFLYSSAFKLSANKMTDILLWFFSSC